MKKYRSYALCAAFLLAVVAGWALSGELGKFIGGSAVEKYQEGKKEGAVAKAQELAAKEMRKQLPIQVDEFTVLQNVLSMNTTLQYHYRLDAMKAEIDVSGFSAAMKEAIVASACSDDGMRHVLNNGGEYSYIYTGAGGDIISKIYISKEDCT